MTTVFDCAGHVPTLSGNRYGHCALCHLDFMGETAWDKHRRGDHGGGRYCVDPAADVAVTKNGTPVARWWQDKKGRWHEGDRDVAADYWDKESA